jgi:hypothetical protein
MNFNAACNLLHIPPDQFNEKNLKKMYRRACLRHHPDKKGDPSEFIKITSAYEFLLHELNTDTEETWLDGIDPEILKSYVTILEKLNHPWIERYLLTPLKYHLCEYKTVGLNPSLKQLFNKELYYLESVHSYIPLWHQEVTIKKTTVYITPILPPNVTLDENNNVIVKLCSYQDSIVLGGISFLLKEKEKMCFKRQGIPRIRTKIYEIELSDVIVFISSQPS